MLVGITASLYAAYMGSKNYCIYDTASVLFCFMGLHIAYISDNSLNEYMKKNESLKKEGKEVVPILK